MVDSSDDMGNKPNQMKKKAQQRPAAVNSIACINSAYYYCYFVLLSHQPPERSCPVMTMAPTFPSQRC